MIEGMEFFASVIRSVSGYTNNHRSQCQRTSSSWRAFLWITLFGAVTRSTLAGTGKVLLVSFDGFRWDYLNFIEGLSNFEAFAEQGTSAPYMNNTFATMTFPTHYSMATGLYQESHGIVSNYMYDPVFKEDFYPGCCLDQKWWGGEPIWITATKQGKKAGCLFWPGTEVEFDGVLPEYVEKFSNSMPFTDRVDLVLDWFTDGDIDLGTLYFQQPDKDGHKYGPRSPEVANRVREADETLGYLMEQMKQRGLTDEVNVVLVSDHGMANLTFDHVIEVPQYVNMSLVDKFVEVGAVCHVFPKEGHREEVYKQLRGAHEHMTAYRREETPRHWHYTHNRRIGDVLLVLDENWSCTENKSFSWNRELGTHGYDNRVMSMRPIFMAKGPDIKKGLELEPFMSLDIYPLVAELLGVTPAPNNGTMTIVKRMLYGEPETNAVRDSYGIVGGASGVSVCYGWTLLLVLTQVTSILLESWTV